MKSDSKQLEIVILIRIEKPNVLLSNIVKNLKLSFSYQNQSLNSLKISILVQVVLKTTS